jgi:hypothetical protein
MNLGAEPKKLAFLGGLVLIGGYLFYSNVLSGPSAESGQAGGVEHPAAAPAPVLTNTAAQVPARRAASSSRFGEEFRPSLKPKRPEDRVDPMSIDPTLRLDLLAKVQAVDMQGGARNLFQFSTAPPPPLPKEPIVPVKTPQQVAKEEEQKMIEAGPPKPPPPPPITLKYYGYSSARGDNRKHAFFLDGDDILVAAEGEVVKKRYRVVRIGVNSVVMEDTQFKHEQTLPLVQEAAG